MSKGIWMIVVLGATLLNLPFVAQAQVSFIEAPTFTGCSYFMADFNGDGKPDLLCYSGTLNLGNGDGTFTPGTPVVGPWAVADFNGDGRPDVLEQGSGTLAGTLLVQLGNGDGTFQAAIPTLTGNGTYLAPVAAVDLNGDGKADVVGILGNTTLMVYLSKGDGTFKSGVPYNTPASRSDRVWSGDFNGDGKIDVGVGHNILLGNGDGTFQTPKTSSISLLYVAAVGDFNGDGKLDLAGFMDSYQYVPTASIYVQLGNGDGTFQLPALAFPNTGLYGPLGVADVNGDGKLDLIFSAHPSLAQVLLGNGDGTFFSANNYVLTFNNPNFDSFSGGMKIADFNLDGKLDVAVGDAMLLGNGDGTFRGIQFSVTSVDFSQSALDTAVVGDFDKNGTTDIARTSSTSVLIFSNNGAGNLSLIHTYPLPQTVPNSFPEIVTADFSGDGNLDLAVTQDGGYSVLLGNGDGSFQLPVFYPSESFGKIVVADFNNDHKPDLAVSTTKQPSVAILLGNGDGTFASPIYTYDGGGGALLTADFNGDGKLDIALPSPSTKNTAILFGNGDGTFQPVVFPASLGNFTANFTADFNNDGKADLEGCGLVNQCQWQVALGKGDGTFTLLPLSSDADTYDPVDGIADFNGDGKLDMYVEGAGVRLGIGDGTFGPVIKAPTSGHLRPSLFADMNGDGRTDILFSYPLNLIDLDVSVTDLIWYVEGMGVLLQTPLPPDFAIGAASGSGTSQTISAGQTASFSLVLAPAGSFTGTVNLNCVITPTVTPAPTCNLSGSSVQISSSAAQTVTVTVATTAPLTTSATFYTDFRHSALPLSWTLALVGSCCLFLRKRRRVPALAAPVVVLILLSWTSCGGGSSPSDHTTQGTPPGTYTATITATSGSLSHNTALQIFVQ